MTEPTAAGLEHVFPCSDANLAALVDKCAGGAAEVPELNDALFIDANSRVLFRHVIVLQPNVNTAARNTPNNSVPCTCVFDQAAINL